MQNACGQAAHRFTSRHSAFFIPPFTAIQPVSDFFRQHQLPWLTGAQNMHQQEGGAWTGEISASMIAETGATLVEMVHSERRGAFNETDADVNQKVHSALRHDLCPLVCIGDSADEKRWRVSTETVVRQMKIALYGVDAVQAQRGVLCERYGDEMGQSIPLLYGGSVNEQNCVELIAQPDIDGLFIGRAAWDASGYCAIVQRLTQDFIVKAQ